jgi:myo-inositol-1-phosphate synthase
MTEGRDAGTKIRVAIVGVGNCATSLVQGVHYYRDADPATRVPGLMHVRFGDYHVGDLSFVAAFDVDAKKVGRDLSEAIVASENNTISICDVPPLGIMVRRGHTMDGLGEYYRNIITESDEKPVDVVEVLAESGADVLVSYLPVGSVMTSSRRSGRRSRIGCWPSFSRTAEWSWCALTSSTSAATWIS